MELKYEVYYHLRTCLDSSNRTFMELKYIKKGGEDGVQQVLIVPLWN